MTDDPRRQSGEQARRSVWTLAAAGSLAGLVLFVTVAIVLLDLRNQRHRHEEARELVSAALSEATDGAVQMRDWVVGTLVSIDRSSGGADHRGRDFERSVTRIASRMQRAELPEYGAELDRIAGQMEEVAAATQRWSDDHATAVESQSLARRAVRDALQRLQGFVAQLDGERRLKLAIDLRDGRRSEAGPSAVAREQIYAQLTQQSALSSISTDLACLEAAIESLLGETDGDRLIDVRENTIKPLLDGLVDSCERIAAGAVLRRVRAAILGPNERSGGPPPSNSGLLCRTESLLCINAEREVVLAEATAMYDHWRRALATLEARSARETAQAAKLAEAALTRVWIGCAALGVVANLFFFSLASRIARTIDQQIGSIDKASRELAQAQKLESVGQLAAGIAHEMNTPMQYIYDNIHYLVASSESLFGVLELYDQLLDESGAEIPWEQRIQAVTEARRDTRFEHIIEEIPKAIADSRAGLNRVLEIIHAMKTFSHPGEQRFMSTDLNQVIRDASIITRNRWKYHAELVTDLDLNLPAVPALTAEINQVVLNLIVNASDAIAEKVGDDGALGRITVSTSSREGDAVVRVVDTGAGIPESVRDRIFEPFFTTKEVGQGSGQGLAICYNVIVEKHGGKLEVDTTPGEGTEFRFTLPIDRPLGEECPVEPIPVEEPVLA